MRKPIIAGNWKLFKTQLEAADFVNSLKPLVANQQNVEIVIAPVFTALAASAQAMQGSNIRLAAQDCFWEEGGAFTGEVSPGLLKDVGCSHVIIGHSERRQYFGETDESVNKKTKAAIAQGLVVLLCVGESLAEREAGDTFKVIEGQIKGGLVEISSSELNKLVVAYEPVWAIGTGKTASDEQAQEVHNFIRKLVSGLYSQADADKLRILYGGSVKPENVKGLMSQPDIDGALVGGASLQPDSFAGIVNFSS